MDNSNKGVFAGFTLLKEPVWDPAKFENEFAAEWGIWLSDKAAKDPATRVYSIPGIGEKTILAISLVKAQVPGDEAVANAQYNYMWGDAVSVAKTHKAHLIVSVLGADNARDGGTLYAKAMTTLCRDANTIGYYHNGVVLQPAFVLDAGKLIKSSQLPVLSLVWFGLSRTENGVSAYTTGLTNLGKDEIEILDTKEDPIELRSFLFNVVVYVLEEDVTLHDGETIGVDENQRLKIEKSEGINVTGDSLKIKYL